MKRQWRPGLIWLVVVSLMGAAWWLAPEVAAAREAVVSCVFTGTAPGGNLFVAGDPEDISSAHRVSLYGVRIPPQAQPAFNKYVQRMLGGAQLCVRIKQRITGQSIPGLVGEVMIAQGIAYASLNKAVLRDGYGQLTADAPAAYRPFAAYAKRRRSGLYSVGRPRWPLAPLPTPAAKVGEVGPQQHAGNTKNGVTLTFWCSPYGNETGWAITLTHLWNQTHPGVHVRLQRFPLVGEPEQVLRDAIAARRTPDITNHLFPAEMPDLAHTGGLVALDRFPPLMAAARRRSGDAAMQWFRATDGHVYQVPWKCNPIMLQYNVTLLKKAGVGVPRTYKQFLAVADALHRRGVYAWAPDPNDRWFKRYCDFYPLYFAAGAGKPFLNAKGQPAFDNAAGAAVLDFLRQSFQRGFAPSRSLYTTDVAANEAFVTGRLGFLVTGPWNVPEIDELAETSFRYDFCPLPVPDGTDPRRPVVTYGNFRNIGIFSTCQHKTEAAQFVQFLMSRHADESFLEMCSELPFRVHLLSDASFTALVRERPYLAPFARQVDNVRPVENSPNFNKVLNAVSHQFVECAVKGVKSGRQAVQDAAREARRL